MKTRPEFRRTQLDDRADDVADLRSNSAWQPLHFPLEIPGLMDRGGGDPLLRLITRCGFAERKTQAPGAGDFAERIERKWFVRLERHKSPALIATPPTQRHGLRSFSADSDPGLHRANRKSDSMGFIAVFECPQAGKTPKTQTPSATRQGAFNEKTTRFISCPRRTTQRRPHRR